MSKLLTAAFLTTLMTSTAFAQTDSGNTGASSEPMAPSASDSATGGMAPDWNQTIVDAFYEDPSAAVVKSDADLKTAWDSLSPEDQAEVEEHCSTMSADAGASGSLPSDAGSGSDASTDTAASGTTGSSTGTMSGSESSDMASSSDSSSDMEEDAGSSGSSTMAETDTMESEGTDSAASATVDTEATTGSTSTDTGASAGAGASADASGADVELTAASVQQICTSIESF